MPISNFPTLIKETKEDLVNLNVIAPICGHAGDGVSGAVSSVHDKFSSQGIAAEQTHSLPLCYRTSMASSCSGMRKSWHASKKVSTA